MPETPILLLPVDRKAAVQCGCNNEYFHGFHAELCIERESVDRQRVSLGFTQFVFLCFFEHEIDERSHL